MRIKERKSEKLIQREDLVYIKYELHKQKLNEMRSNGI